MGGGKADEAVGARVASASMLTSLATAAAETLVISHTAAVGKGWRE